jgi:DNA-binding winged helix-turn-helix (wHTH) protein
MPLKQVDLTLPLQPLDWFVPDLLLCGYLNFVASLPGQGKTTLLTALAWQASRPGGGEFLGERVRPGATIFVDFDAPGDGRSVRYWLAKHQTAYPDGDMDKIIVLEPDADTYGMGDGEFATLATLARDSDAGLIIVDSFMAAFPSTDPAKLTAVQGPLWYMRRLAAETNAAVILIDHLPKPVNGEAAGSRGVMGSVAKPAQSRAVHLLTRVPPAEVQGRNVLRWDVSKMSFAALPEPFGVELVFEGDALRVEPTALPESHNETKLEKAVRAALSFLELNRGRVVGRKELLDVAIKVANVAARTAAEALKLLRERLGDELVTVSLPGQGNPTGYRLAEGESDSPPDNEAPHVVASLHQKAETPFLSSKSLVQPPLHESAELHQKNDADGADERLPRGWAGVEL